LWDGRAQSPAGRRKRRLEGLEGKECPSNYGEQRCPSSVFLGAPGGADRIERRSPGIGQLTRALVRATLRPARMREAVRRAAGHCNSGPEKESRTASLGAGAPV